MATFEETVVVLQEVAKHFNHDEVRKIKEIETVVKDTENIKIKQLTHLAALLEECRKQVEVAEKEYAAAALDPEFDNHVGQLDEEQLNLAKYINKYESTCRALERNLSNVSAQQAVLQQVGPTLKAIDEVKDNIAKKYKKIVTESSPASIADLPDLRQQIAHLDRLIAEMDQHKALAEDAARLRQLQARLLSSQALAQDIESLKQTLEASWYLQFYKWICSIDWAKEPGRCEGVMKGGYHFNIDAETYGPVFIANHLWEMIDARGLKDM